MDEEIELILPDEGDLSITVRPDDDEIAVITLSAETELSVQAMTIEGPPGREGPIGPDGRVGPPGPQGPRGVFDEPSVPDLTLLFENALI